MTLNGNRTIGNITFTDGTTSSHNLTISGANILTLAGTTPTISVTQSDRSLTISSVISGSGGLTKNGSGTLIITGNGSYTGNTVINAGILQVGNNTNTGSLGSNTNTSIAAGAELRIERLNTGGSSPNLGSMPLGEKF